MIPITAALTDAEACDGSGLRTINKHSDKIIINFLLALTNAEACGGIIACLDAVLQRGRGTGQRAAAGHEGDNSGQHKHMTESRE